MRTWGWAGLAIILLAELGLFVHVKWVGIYFTPLAWTGYILFVDALVGVLRGRSCLAEAPRDFLGLVFWSAPLWLIFEAYNLRLENWTYVGLPSNVLWRAAGFTWSFATIWPAIYETADLLQALGLGKEKGARRLVLRASRRVMLFALGAILVTAPVLVSPRLGSYMFGAIWLGFILLLDPLNRHWGGRSLLGDLEQGSTAVLYPFLASGFVCGLLWEFWNYWASAKWMYVFPIAQNWKLFEMPLPGFLGFPPFALECFVMYEFLRTARKELAGLRRGILWEAEGSTS